MEIKLITHKELNKLLKLKVNKGFNENFSLFLLGLMHKEINFIAIENKEILGAFSYSKSYPMGKNTIEGIEYDLQKPMKYLEFIEVKPSAKNKGVGKALAKHMFEICAQLGCGIKISNIVLEGQYLVNTYKKLSNEYQVDLFFYHVNKLDPQIFNAEPIKKPTFFQKLFKHS